MRRTRVLVADGMPVFRSGVQALLARETEFEVLAAPDLATMLDLVTCDCPDLALIDLDLPPAGGVGAVALLRERCSCQTVVWSFTPDKETVLEAISAGACGYLDKMISPAGLVRALRGVREGQAPLSRDLASLMVEALHGAQERDRARERVAVLSPRERQVLGLVARGARNRQIAQVLFISEFTVKRHMQNILHKLDLPSRRAAARSYRAAFGADGVAEAAAQGA